MNTSKAHTTMNTTQNTLQAQVLQAQVLQAQVLQAQAQDTLQAQTQDTGANACIPGCGWLKLFRCFTEWEWYSDTNTVRLFLHLLLKANYREHRWKGRVIPRGSIVTSLASLAAETSLSVQNVRTCLAHLKSTGEINITSTPCFTLISINNYARYQDGGTCSETPKQQSCNTPSTQYPQTSNKPLTTLKESKKEIKKENKNIRESSGFAKAQPALALAPQSEQSYCDVASRCYVCKSSAPNQCAECRNATTPCTNTEEKRGAGAAPVKSAVNTSSASKYAANDSEAENKAAASAVADKAAADKAAADKAAVSAAADASGARRGVFTTPDVEQVRRYAEVKGLEGFDAEAFTDYYTANGWRVGHAPMRDWQAAVRNWARRQELMDACTLRRSGTSAARANDSRSILNVNDQWKGFALPQR